MGSHARLVMPLNFAVLLDREGLLRISLNILSQGIGSEANGIQLGAKCVLYQGLAQQTSWFAHKREGFGPPLFDSGLDAVRTHGIDEQELQRYAGVRGPEPP
jgi:hypothetical protein